MTITEKLEKIKLSKEQVDKVNDLIIQEIFEENKKTIEMDYILYYKELNMKKRIEEQRLSRYVFEHEAINGVLEPVRKQESETRLRMQNNFLAKFKDFYFKFEKMLLDYANTFCDKEVIIFIDLYLKGLNVKQVASKMNLSVSRIRQLKVRFDKEINELFVNDELIK